MWHARRGRVCDVRGDFRGGGLAYLGSRCAVPLAFAFGDVVVGLGRQCSRSGSMVVLVVALVGLGGRV